VPVSWPELSLLCVLVFVAAVVYSSGGHAGASAYLAAMALFGVAPEAMKPTALLMNIVVATVGTIRFTRARAVPWRLLAWLCLGSIPAAFLGGRVGLPSQVFQPLLGALLLVAAARLWIPDRGAATRPAPAPPWLVAIGASIGLVAGLTGIGGGIFLSPIVILSGWEEPRRAGGAAVVFILVNSVLGLLGHVSVAAQVPPVAGVLAAVALVGGLIGSWAGVNRLKPLVLRRVHAIVLVTSSVKLFVDGLR
jgi:uncharacterized membrane protein YfcA